jgi:hypothetical protein
MDCTRLSMLLSHYISELPTLASVTCLSGSNDPVVCPESVRSLRCAGRFDVLVLIASLADILLWLIGTAAERAGVHERLRPGSRKRRAYSRLFLARLLLTLEHCKTAIADLLQAVGPLDQWVASNHDSLLAE